MNEGGLFTYPDLVTNRKLFDVFAPIVRDQRGHVSCRNDRKPTSETLHSPSTNNPVACHHILPICRLYLIYH